MSIMTNLGFVPKGRSTVRKATPSGREPRRIDLWDLQPKPGSPLERLERAYPAALRGFDKHEQRLAEARAIDHALTFAASSLVPRLHRERQAVDQGKDGSRGAAQEAEVAGRQDPRRWHVQEFHDTSPASWRFSAIALARAMGSGAAVPIKSYKAPPPAHWIDALRQRPIGEGMSLPLGFVPQCLPTKAPQPPSGDAGLHEPTALASSWRVARLAAD